MIHLITVYHLRRKNHDTDVKKSIQPEGWIEILEYSVRQVCGKLPHDLYRMNYSNQ